MISFDVMVNNQRIGRIECVNVGPTTDGCHGYEITLKTRPAEHMRWRQWITRSTGRVDHLYTDGWHALLKKCLSIFGRQIQNDWDRRRTS